MTRRLPRYRGMIGAVILVLSSSVAMQAQSRSQIFRCKKQRPMVDLSINDTGVTVEGPTCAEIVVNAVRYQADFGKTVTSTAGTNLGSIFPPTFSPGGGGAVAPPQTLEDQFNADRNIIQSLAGQVPLVELRNRTTSSDTDKYLAKLRALIVQTDDILRTGGPRGVLAVVQSPDALKEIDDALRNAFNWQATDNIIAGLTRVQIDLNSLPIRFPSNTGTITGDSCSSANIGLLGWSDWSKCRDTQFKAAQAMVTAALAEAAPWTSDGDKAAQFAKKVGIIQYWKNTITGVSESSFTLQSEVACGVLFNRNQQTVLKLLLVDRTSVFDGPLAQAQVKDGLLTVNCSSPFTVSAGAAFSTISNPQFAIVKSAPPSGTTSINTFGMTSNSKINPYPIAMANARLVDWEHNRYALHYSFGVGVNPNGAGGNSAEFLTGPSLSFLRTVFVTVGLDVGKQSKLAGGFSVGGTVPTDISTPPISTSYTAGFGFAITFTKP